MSNKSRVIWSEGMFLRPQHFQQQDRFLETWLESRVGVLNAYGWGFTKLRIDQELLRLGKISVVEAEGIFPDGTPFCIPDNDPPPEIIEIPVNTRDEDIYLCLPLRRPGTRESARVGEQAPQARYFCQAGDVRNNASETAEVASIEMGQMALTLKPATDDRNGYAVIGVTRVLERQPDHPVKLDNNYIPPLLDCQLSPITSGYIEELIGLLRQRANALSYRLCDSGRAGSAEIADYMLLQVINRYEPLMIELSRQKLLHPFELYKELVQLSGELSTFTASKKRPESFPPFSLDTLGEIFASVVSTLRQSLSMVLEQTAISLELTQRKFGIYVSPVNDRSLIDGASFVLAVKADMPGEALRNNFPSQAKVAPVEVIRELIGASMPGVMLRPLPVAPRQIPYHAGFAYFELEKNGKAWAAMKNSGGFAIHLGAEFPGLEMEFWAVRD